MKAFVKVKKQVELKTLRVMAGVRYWEDSMINGVYDEEGTLTPCRKGENWCPDIDIDTGVVLNWELGKRAEIHFKVCDDGCYYLLDENDNVQLSIEGDYVPEMMCPKENGYGDYIIMDIDEIGKIKDWKKTLSGFVNDDEEE